MKLPSYRPPTVDRPGIEPGLVSVFVLFLGLYLAVDLLWLIASLSSVDSELYISTLFSVAWVAFLLTYLLWPRVSVLMGQAFLPVALVVAATMPIINRGLLLWQLRSDLRPEALPLVIGSSWHVLLVLFLPLILIAWQYRFRDVVLFLAGTTILDILLVSLAWGDLFSYEMGFVVLTSVRAVVYFVVGFIVVRLMESQRDQRAELAVANRQLLQYATTAEQLATSRERNRLARELHDTVAHTLSGLAVQLEAVDAAWEDNPEQAHLLVQKAIAGTRSGLTETRRALQALRASPLEDLGLALAIRTLAHSTAARSSITLRIDVPDQVNGLTPEQEQAAYRIAQEAMNNATNHSGATELSVSLQPAEGGVILSIGDNGAGFDVDSVDTARYGLRGMQERAETVDSELTISSEPGSGTSVMLDLPTA